ncbi:PQ loop repeat protein-like protein [Pseudovirgaria hyperparasitica]|uniref:PQ loop repeat protein-like protein n=1 Tax=Pseudovirgaria hyperparasitica TaxID=470096 RepID=A0A6A6VW27_9PEZI|nr:PQ loop repeat protein-like protein [Pseudovirgaria hyperparasitica]KAF2754365.1 PQ loop repeat protein-like protein [Pseudovirgaria hyperparasitica]
MSDFKDRCNELAHPDPANFGISLFLLVGIIVSYLPQHYKIISRRSSHGISSVFVLLGTVSGTAGIANILTLPISQEDMMCCKKISDFACGAALLGVFQVGVQWACFFLILLLFLLFFPRSSTDSPGVTGISAWKEALGVLFISMVFFLTVFILSLFFTFGHRSALQSWANFLGIAGASLAAIQYIPQIVTTLRLQNIYSLSIPMMLLQTPGSFIWSASLYARLGKAGWSTWGLYLVTGCLQGVLLCIAIAFWWRDRNDKKLTHAEHRDPADDPEPIDESTPLDPEGTRSYSR